MNMIFINKKLCLFFVSFLLLLISCKNKELTKEIALPLIANYYGFGYPSLNYQYGENITHEEKKIGPSRRTKIAIDKKIDNYGWPPEKYKQLEQEGIISLDISEGSMWIWGKIEASVTESGNKYLHETRIWKNTFQFLFDGYSVNISGISISSNAENKSAEAIVNFYITGISPIQQIFRPVENQTFNSTVYFKLYDDGWKIQDNVVSHIRINLIDNPLHWLNN